MQQAIDALLSDLERDPAAVALKLEVSVDPSRECPTWVVGPSGSAVGVVAPVGLLTCDAIRIPLDQLHDFIVEELAAAGLSSSWPECPVHPGSHPLQLSCGDGHLMWRCPKAGRDIAALGGWRSDPTSAAEDSNDARPTGDRIMRWA